MRDVLTGAGPPGEGGGREARRDTAVPLEELAAFEEEEGRFHRDLALSTLSLFQVSSSVLFLSCVPPLCLLMPACV